MRLTGSRRSVLWHGRDPFSAEILSFERIADHGWRMTGTVVVALPEGAAEVRYALEIDDGWRSRRLDVEIAGARAARMIAVGDGAGAWTVDGADASDLRGCIDVDLGVSPATNTLPIRRSHPAVGETISTRVAWVRFPELTVQPDHQTYERAGDRTWVFRSDDFRAELDVDDEGLVVRYGDLWKRVDV